MTNEYKKVYRTGRLVGLAEIRDKADKLELLMPTIASVNDIKYAYNAAVADVIGLIDKMIGANLNKYDSVDQVFDNLDDVWHTWPAEEPPNDDKGPPYLCIYETRTGYRDYIVGEYHHDYWKAKNIILYKKLPWANKLPTPPNADA